MSFPFASHPPFSVTFTLQKGNKKERLSPLFLLNSYLLTKVTLQQALEGLAVAGLVACHFMDGIVDGVQIVPLGPL